MAHLPSKQDRADGAGSSWRCLTWDHSQALSRATAQTLCLHLPGLRLCSLLPLGADVLWCPPHTSSHCSGFCLVCPRWGPYLHLRGHKKELHWVWKAQQVNKETNYKWRRLRRLKASLKYLVKQRKISRKLMDSVFVSPWPSQLCADLSPPKDSTVFS